MLMIFSLSLTLSFMFILLSHPLSFGFILLIETIIISLMTGMVSLNFWFSYIILLIMVGGMLILFIYMTSVASNEKFQFSIKIPLMFIPLFTVTSIVMWIALSINFKINNYETNLKIEPINISMVKYMSIPNSVLMILMIIYLLITLIVVVKITNINYGPLRQKF